MYHGFLANVIDEQLTL